MIVKAIITTLDNLPMLQEQIPILQTEGLDGIIVVNNGSRDGTKEYLDSLITHSSAGAASPIYTESWVLPVHRENLGAGPGRNAGLDAAGEFDYVLMLDGGIRPLRGGVKRMLDYLEANPDVDVISPEIATCFTADKDLAHRRFAGPIDSSMAFRQRCLSSTAYALCRYRAFDGIRYCEEGPFGQPGWGVDDNELAAQWEDKGIVHRDFARITVGKESIQLLLYRRASGSFSRLFQETGVWPNQYGSVFEQRNVMLTQLYPQYYNPPWHTSTIEVSCVVVGWNEYPIFAKAIKRLHDDLADISHEIIFVDNGSTDETKWWLDTFALRQHHGDTTIDAETGKILLRRNKKLDLEPIWTGNVIRVDLPENMGTGAGLNAGFEKARGKYVFYLSGDILPVKDSISALKKYLDDHDDADYIGLNAWACQDEDEDPPFRGDFEGWEDPDGTIYPGPPRQGLGNYAYSYAMIRREIVDAGCRMADTGPFAGAGCGYEECEFVNRMYEKGFRGWLFNDPSYYHHRRDFDRSGHEGPSADKTANLDERIRWLRVRWPEQAFNHTHHPNQPPPRHIRRVAVIQKPIGAGVAPDHKCIGHHWVDALNQFCIAEKFAPGEEPEGWDSYLFVDNGDFDHFPCPEHAHPSIFIATDMTTPQQVWRPSLDGYVERAKTFDRVYANYQDSAAYFREHGVGAEWMVQAANPTYHKPWDEEVIWDWIALWHNVPMRIEYTELLRETFPNAFVGYREGNAYSQWMCRARCAINVSRSSELNTRVFEIMAMGVPLVTDRVRDLDVVFEEGKHYLGFDSPEELVERVRWVQKHLGEANAMASRARVEILSKHTFYHRVLSLYAGGNLWGEDDLDS